MPGFTTHTGSIAVVPQDHVDTDRIIPARYLSRVTRAGYGEELFRDVRGPDFPLDQTQAKGATILVVGTNFGCGSSREHAVWAIQQAGFRAVVARRETESPGFSDIFRGNAANCGLLLIELDPSDHALLSSLGSGAEVEVDLPNQQIRTTRDTVAFTINPATKAALLEGLDLIGTTLRYEGDIATYEADHPQRVGAE
jgi:3-isopropylmalate/(R)-2-methylmalate dehydratase small subunit